ncbi:MAG: replication initiation protein [Defluviitaleaceae bacterium]|nr:replication initiation protein [Defluviitaleaceae bacterium]
MVVGIDNHTTIMLKYFKLTKMGGFMASIKLKKNHVVVKHNTLNEVRTHNMTLQELRLFTIYLSKINPKNKETKRVVFSLSDFQSIMELKQLNAPYFKKVAYNLINKPVEVTTKRGGFSVFNIFREFTVDADENGEWYIEIDADEKAVPLLFDFQGQFFKYELWNALRLKSKNQLRMYEVLKQYEKIGSKVVAVKDLKDLLGIGEKEYPLFKNFRQDVLEVCKKALSENTDISYTYEPHGKKGRGGKILELKFSITKNKDFQDPLQLDEFIEINKVNIDENNDIRTIERHPLYEERITYLMTACLNEFSHDEMIVLYDEMREAVPFLCDNELTAHDYLQKKYNEMQMRSPEKSRLGYLRAMISKDKDITGGRST